MGAGVRINFQTSLIGHPACNRYGMCLEANGKLFDAFDDAAFIGRMHSATAHLELHRNDAKSVVRAFLRWLGANPMYLFPAAKWAARKAWNMRKDLLAARGRIRTISFVIHNFMDRCALERDRIDGCIFKAMTAGGPISMCMHNAKRDKFILQPTGIETPEGTRYWQPLTGNTAPNRDGPDEVKPERHALKRLKGLARQRLIAQRRA
jgi:hypothetical protein